MVTKKHHEKKNKIIFFCKGIFLLLIFFSINIYADSNGIWEFASDLRVGIFGEDENDTTSPYTFQNPLILTNNLTTSGNIGVGTLPSSIMKLNIMGDIAIENGNFYMDNSKGLFSKNSLGEYEQWMWPRWSDNIMYTNFGENGWNIRNSDSESVIFMDSSGNVGIGTSNPEYVLDVNGATQTNYLRINPYTDSSTEGGEIRFDGASEYDTFYIDNYMGNARIHNIDENNYFEIIGGKGIKVNPLYDRDDSEYYVDPNLNSRINTIYATAYYYDSDKTLKKDIKLIENPIEKIKELNGVEFTWKENDKEDIGLIAQEVEEVLPVLVSTNEEGLKSVKYGNIVSVLIEAVKEQQNQIEELESRIDELESK